MVTGQEIKSEAESQGGKIIDRASSAMRDAREYAGETLSRASEGVGPGVGEGRITKTIEHYTSRVPSGTYLTLALGAMAGSALLAALNRREDANFVGQWVPTILIMGLYNKLVKLEGSE